MQVEAENKLAISPEVQKKLDAMPVEAKNKLVVSP